MPLILLKASLRGFIEVEKKVRNRKAPFYGAFAELPDLDSNQD
jgi:hypothetical protein